MSDIQLYYDASGHVLIECDGRALELSRLEAEEIFVTLGHILQDMDLIERSNNEDDG